MTISMKLARRSGAAGQVTQEIPPRPRAPRSVKESAAYYNVSTQTVRRLIKAGKLKTYRVGRQIRIDESDLVDCMSPGVLK